MAGLQSTKKVSVSWRVYVHHGWGVVAHPKEMLINMDRDARRSHDLSNPKSLHHRKVKPTGKPKPVCNVISHVHAMKNAKQYYHVLPCIILRADDIGICWANETGFFVPTILSQLLSHFPVV